MFGTKILATFRRLTVLSGLLVLFIVCCCSQCDFVSGPCFVVQCFSFISSIVIISQRKSELVALLCIFSLVAIDVVCFVALYPRQ